MNFSILKSLELTVLPEHLLLFLEFKKKLVPNILKIGGIPFS